MYPGPSAFWPLQPPISSGTGYTLPTRPGPRRVRPAGYLLPVIQWDNVDEGAIRPRAVQSPGSPWACIRVGIFGGLGPTSPVGPEVAAGFLGAPGAPVVGPDVPLFHPVFWPPLPRTVASLSSVPGGVSRGNSCLGTLTSTLGPSGAWDKGTPATRPEPQVPL